MKQIAVVLAVMVMAVIFTGCASLDGARRDTLVSAEYRNINVDHKHKTHPDDAGFLEGDAGSTDIKNAYFVAFTGRLTKEKVSDTKVDVYVEGSILVGGGQEKKKNENDPRPTGNHSEIYSKVFPIAPEVATGVRYNVTNKFAVGAEVSAAYFWVEHGWNRFGKDDKSDTEGLAVFNVGPKLTWKLSEDMFLEAGAGFGNSETYSIGVGYRF